MNILEDLKAKKKVDFKILFDYFSKDFPLLKDFKNTEQDPIWHAEGNVYIHTEMVINSLYDILKQEDISGEEFRILILSALFHDIAKPITTKEREREGRIQIVSPKHEYMGMSYSFYRLLNYDLSLDEIKMIVSLIGYHQVPKLLVVRDEGFEKYLELSLNTNLRLIYLLEKADMTGRTCSDLDIQLEYLELFKLYSLEYGLWKSSLKQKEIKDMCDNDFVYYRGVKNLFEKEIFQIEEANAKYYKESKNYSHVKILVALSGTGKSHYSNSIDSSFNIISLDKLREKHKTRNKKTEGWVLQESKELLKEKLAKKENIVLDATHYRKDFREKVIKIIEAYGGLPEIVFIFDTISNILIKDKNRKSTVGEAIIKNQLNKFEIPEISETPYITYIDLRKKD